MYFFTRSLFVNGLLLLIPLLLVGSYSLVRTTAESSQEAKRHSASILNQADAIFEEFYTHVDNAYLFFSSNPRVSFQLQHAFREKTLSLDSIKSAESISLNFQNLIYTSDFIQAIYIYYKNDHGRIFAPLNSKILSFSPENEARIMEFYDHLSTEDVWFAFSDEPFLYSESSSPSLLICRNLYRRTTASKNGIVVFSFHAGKLERELQKLLDYQGQLLFLIDPQSHSIWPSSDLISNEDIMELYSHMKETSSSTFQKQTVSEAFGTYEATFLPSPRSYGFSYLLLTPKSEIYKTTRSLTGAYFLVLCLAVAAAFLLAYLKTKHDYKYLNRIISVFSNPSTSVIMAQKPQKRASSPFEFILTNVIRLFIEQDYLKIQASEKDARLQLWKMEALQHQINPHFLHNTLNSIYWESVKLTSSENLCSEMISNLSSIMRYSLDAPQEDVCIADEIAYLQQYLDIMQLRYPEKFDIEFSIEPGCEQAAIKKMLLQPLIENSIYHGLRAKPGKGLIRLSIQKQSKQLSDGCRLKVLVYDTGQGISPDRLLKLNTALKENENNIHQHIGLANTNARLILSYGKEAAIHIESEYQTFTAVSFSIPLTPAS